MNIFITHGHDESAKLKVQEFIQQIGHVPVILGQQPQRQGLTIIEALEKFSIGCEFAVVLLTGDDVTSDGGRRARQNVIHEIGFFQGRLGRARVVLIVQMDVDIPSNLKGLFYLEYGHDIQEVYDDLRKMLDSGNASTSARELSPDEWQHRKDRFDRYSPGIQAFLKEIIAYKIKINSLLSNAKKKHEAGQSDDSVTATVEMDDARGKLYAAYLTNRHLLDETLLEQAEKANDRLVQVTTQRSRAADPEWLKAHMDDAMLDYENYLREFDNFVETITKVFEQQAHQLRI